MAGGGEVGHGLHHAVIGVESGLGQVLAIAGGGDGGHVESRMLLIQLLQHLPDEGNRIAQIGTVIRKEDAGLLVDDHQLYGGGAGVDADVHRRRVIGAEGHPGHRGLGVAGAEGLIFLLIGKQGRLGAVRLRCTVEPELVRHLPQVKFLVRVKSGAQGHE